MKLVACIACQAKYQNATVVKLVNGWIWPSRHPYVDITIINYIT